MRCAIVYWSRFGNGKNISKTLATKLRARGLDVVLMDAQETTPDALEVMKLYVFSAPVEKFTIPKDMKELMTNLKGVEGKAYGLVNTHRLRWNKLRKMEKILSKKKMVKIAGINYRLGEGTEEGRGLEDGWERSLDEFVQNFCSNIKH